jgi:hypothetical protein
MEYYVQQFKQKIFICVPKSLRRMTKYLVIITSDFKPIGVIICINEKLLEEYSKYKWKKLVLRCGINKDVYDIILKFDYRTCKLILNEACKSQKRYKIICNLSHLEYNVYQ